MKISWFSVDVKVIVQLSKEGTWSLNSCHSNQTRIFTYFKFSKTIKGGGGGGKEGCNCENSKFGLFAASSTSVGSNLKEKVSSR